MPTTAERMISAIDKRIDAIVVELQRARPGFDFESYLGWGHAWGSHQALRAFFDNAYLRRAGWVDARDADDRKAASAEFKRYRQELAWGEQAPRTLATCPNCGVKLAAGFDVMVR